MTTLINEKVTSITQLKELETELESAIKAGLTLYITTSNTELSTQDLADFLNISRPTAVKLIDSGKIPCIKPGKSHRRVLFEDALKYKEGLLAEQKEFLQNQNANPDIVTSFFKVPVDLIDNE